MKKILLATLLVAAVSAASALEVGVNTSRTYAGNDRTAYGVTLGGKVAGVDVTAGYDHYASTTNPQDRYTVVGAYPLTKVGPVSLAAKGGVAYLNNKLGADGYAALVGVGATLPVAKNVSLVADYAYQGGQKRVEAFNGNTLSVGVKYAF